MFSHGDRCWNGPDRSLRVMLHFISCISVFSDEKCKCPSPLCGQSLVEETGVKGSKLPAPEDAHIW